MLLTQQWSGDLPDFLNSYLFLWNTTKIFQTTEIMRKNAKSQIYLISFEYKILFDLFVHLKTSLNQKVATSLWNLAQIIVSKYDKLGSIKDIKYFLNFYSASFNPGIVLKLFKFVRKAKFPFKTQISKIYIFDFCKKTRSSYLINFEGQQSSILCF
jgi:hypothetical protein